MPKIIKFEMKKLLIILTLFSLSSCDLLKKSSKNNDKKEFELQQINMQFVEGSQDIPLAKGLEKIEDESLTFDSFNGNVLSISYKTKQDLEEIRDFYLKTLPQMGWKIVKNQRPTSIEVVDFERENEKLEIEFVNKDGQDLVKFYAELGV